MTKSTWIPGDKKTSDLWGTSLGSQKVSIKKKIAFVSGGLGVRVLVSDKTIEGVSGVECPCGGLLSDEV